MSENVTLKVYYGHEEAVLSLVRLRFFDKQATVSDVSGFVPRFLARSSNHFSN